MNKQDANLVDDLRTVELAKDLGIDTTAVVEIAEEISAEVGDTVSEEIDEGLAEVAAQK